MQQGQESPDLQVQGALSLLHARELESKDDKDLINGQVRQ
jgi:hypothetical protein